MAMEESKELQTAYKIFRSLIYVSVVLEFFMFALDSQILDFGNGIVGDIHGRMKQWFIYNDGHLIYCKIATFLLVCITCIGTRNKKQLEFDLICFIGFSLQRFLSLCLIHLMYNVDDTVINHLAHPIYCPERFMFR